MKDNRTPEEAGMKLKINPYRPNIFSVVVSETVENIWQDFQKDLSKSFL